MHGFETSPEHQRWFWRLPHGARDVLRRAGNDARIRCMGGIESRGRLVIGLPPSFSGMEQSVKFDKKVLRDQFKD